MADTDRRRSWEARSDLEATAIVAPAVRARVAAFLTAVLAAIDALAATLPDATADDLIAVLGPHVLHLSGPAPTRTVSALVGVVVDRLDAALDDPHAGPVAEARLHTCRVAVDAALAGKAATVQWAIVAIYPRLCSSQHKRGYVAAVVMWGSGCIPCTPSAL